MSVSNKENTPPVTEDEALRALNRLKDMVSTWPVVSGHAPDAEYRLSQSLRFKIREGLGAESYAEIWEAAKAGDPDWIFLKRIERERDARREKNPKRKAKKAAKRSTPEARSKAIARTKAWRLKAKVVNVNDVTAAGIIEELSK